MSGRAVTLIGIGADGCASLPSRAINALARARVLAGGERQLDFFREFDGERIVLQGGLSAAVARIAERAEEENVCVLTSGDPMFYGIGALICRAVGVEHVEVLPQPSSIQWAFARIGQRWDDAEIISFHGRPLEGVVARLRVAAKVACFTDEESSPARIAARMREHGEEAWRAWVCEDLGAADERVRSLSIAELAEVGDIRPLNVLILCRTDSSWTRPPTIPYLHEDAFAKRIPKKGLITKREVRTLALAAMRLRPDSVVWDIGAGSGSVAIEAAMLAPAGRVFAIEVDPEGVAICRDNVRTFGVDNVHVIAGRAPAALGDLSPKDDPDAIFVGGSKGSMDEIIEVALARLRAGGRLVVTAITLENVGETYRALRARGYEPELSLVSIARGAPLARYFRYEAQNPIHLFAVTKEPAQ